VKIFKRSQKDAGTIDGDEVRRAFTGEAAVLHDLSQFNHPHIVGKIAAIEYGDKYILLSQWADGGDLRKFWCTNPKPRLDAHLVQQALVQLTGLASAIHTLHTNNDKMSPLTRTDTMREALPVLVDSPTVPSIIVADDMPLPSNDVHFRHGDLKPENIFVFRIEGDQFGLCKIGDLGLAKRHFAPTVHRRQKTDTKYGTVSYEPPEAFTMRGRPRSRLYDIWSYGCIMFETIIWLLYGDQGLKNFWDLHVDKSKGTLFFTTQNPPFGLRARINHHTSTLMEHMLAEDLRLAGTSSSALRDLLIFIQTKVLVVDLPEVTESPSCRVDAAKLLAEMERILSKANGSDGTEYLFPDTLRIAEEPRTLPIIVDSPQTPFAHLAVPGAVQRVSDLIIGIPLVVSDELMHRAGSTSIANQA
jgi:serine/threonine protein kinase